MRLCVNLFGQHQGGDVRSPVRRRACKPPPFANVAVSRAEQELVDHISKLSGQFPQSAERSGCRRQRGRYSTCTCNVLTLFCLFHGSDSGIRDTAIFFGRHMLGHYRLRESDVSYRSSVSNFKTLANSPSERCAAYRVLIVSCGPNPSRSRIVESSLTHNCGLVRGCVQKTRFLHKSRSDTTSPNPQPSPPNGDTCLFRQLNSSSVEHSTIYRNL